MFWMNDKLVVGIADMKMAQGSGMLVTYALGSCIGICFYDPMLKLAALLHIMLPLNLETGRKSPLKYAVLVDLILCCLVSDKSVQ